MIRLLRLHRMMMSMAIRREVAHRADVWFEVIRTLVGLGAATTALLAVFTRVSTLGGLSAAEAIVLLGVFQLVSGLRQALVEPNLRFNANQVATGEFDALLVQPAPAIFLASLGGGAPLALVQSVSGVIVVVIMVVSSQVTVTATALVAALVLLGCAVVIMWATRCVVAAGAFWAHRFSLDVAYDALWQLGGYPATMLHQPLRAMAHIVPIAFLASEPSVVLVGRASPAWAAVGLGVAAVTTMIAIVVWRTSLRHYTSGTS